MREKTEATSAGPHFFKESRWSMELQLQLATQEKIYIYYRSHQGKIQ